MRGKRQLCFRASALGDDLMVFWAAVAARISGALPEGVQLFFEHEVTRSFLVPLARHFPEISILETPPPLARWVYVRGGADFVDGISAGRILRYRLRSPHTWCEPYAHKWQAEFGRTWQPSRNIRLARKVGLLRAWDAEYSPVYDGWQELSVALGYSPERSRRLAAHLSGAWPTIRARLEACGEPALTPHGKGPALFFPAGNSFQDFGGEFVDQVTDRVPSLQIVRHIGDRRPADLRFGTIEELRALISGASLVITNDSMPSHLAQFYAARHLLLCSRSRPENVCFPGAGNTRLVDLGLGLACRPCAYLPLTAAACAAGFSECVAQRRHRPDGLEVLTRMLEEWSVNSFGSEVEL